MSDQCRLCADQESATAPDGGWLLRTPSWLVRAHPGMKVPGWVAVCTVRHVESLARLTLDEANDLGDVLRRVSAALSVVTGADRVYSYSMGEGVRHVHLLLGPPGGGDERAGRGAAFLARLLTRDERLIDPERSNRVLQALARELGPPPTLT
jgi:diadenosine tetraphosphate (Ap4A) HIT family hydrolase